MSETADRDANRALRERLSDVYGQYEQLRTHLDELPQRLASMQVSAASPDGLVQATVGPRGQLIDLRIDPTAYRSVAADDLARTIVATVGTAAERTAGEVEALLSGYLPPNSGTMRFLRDNDFASLMGRADSIMTTGPSPASASDGGQASAGDGRRPSLGDSGQTSAGDSGWTSRSDSGQASAGDSGWTSRSDSGQPSAGDGRRPSLGDSGQASASDSGWTSVGDSGQASGSDSGWTSVGDSGQPSASDSGWTSRGDSGRVAASGVRVDE